MRDAVEAVDAATSLAVSSVKENLNLTLQVPTGALGAFGALLLPEHNSLKTVVALLAQIFKDGHNDFTSMRPQADRRPGQHGTGYRSGAEKD
jgi:hypothetical protein